MHLAVSQTKLSNPNSALALNRLLQLCSANLPVGGFSFSQGLEFAVEKAWVKDTDTCYNWINSLLAESICATDLAVLPKLIQAAETIDAAAFTHWNEFLIATRESSELRLADLAMGKALIRLLNQLDQIDMSIYQSLFDDSEISFVSAFALAAHSWQINSLTAQAGYCWTVIDNQVAAATKLVPLGQTQAQNLLFKLTQGVDAFITKANQLEDDELGGSLPRMAMASAWHETQYTRLFRS
ncbi:urease accessory protein UreF [Catenovulum maritimum]|uniref:Urease accessory protein UreF n=1 Tax=Catenovulum maritimum TaxID=1513271 RepID=A0A0J8GSV0_9ALTE|nr:urease accessory UreF family protein [Catenovulum maritimum]KMT64364.1 urease accessory protein UreF [Catenovulum maritimum]